MNGTIDQYSTLIKIGKDKRGKIRNKVEDEEITHLIRTDCALKQLTGSQDKTPNSQAESGIGFYTPLDASTSLRAFALSLD